ncbi:UNVERIFIED_ORG: hypothetical protein M2435_001755 [Rhizobium sophorae]|uniref:hypothetical protein n=1 Tax=Rhizobium leguminosarum TaxID=384 RepID=UPI00160A4AD6|nr:hypothetical protein [Rhizobium leguminosarum]MBB4521724.1 hypothetical protein [Rhizobium leguminosarum]MDH6658852.1 hypothetical protein [Rhizobium sophorae]
MTDIGIYPEFEHVPALRARALQGVSRKTCGRMTAHRQKLNGGTATVIAICPLLAPALPSFCPRVTIKHVAQKTRGGFAIRARSNQTPKARQADLKDRVAL